MRGLPPLQALLLLVTLAALGVAGKRYIGMRDTVYQVAPTTLESTEHDSTEAEIEFVFSSPPASYTLTQPSHNGQEDKVLFTISNPTQNPCYNTVKLISHQATTYWLDVVWAEDSIDDAHHFVQIYISPVHGENKRISFFSRSKNLNETFDYSTGDHHHE
ncbi:MAG: hypothetical protein ACPIA7_00300 [Akkermansiaceae bacterium]